MIVSFVVVIGILILIHELGHFFVARLCGVGVERFSIGFGPVLLRWRGKETEYALSAIPMGGYVKMMGEENPLEGGAALPFDPRKAFALKPLWARFLIVFAGPGMNFVLAAVMSIGDLLENREIWLLTWLGDPAEMAPVLARLRVFTLVKWYAIFLSCAILAVGVARERGWWRWSAALFALAAVLGFTTVVHPAAVEWSMAPTGLAWAMTWVRALRG